MRLVVDRWVQGGSFPFRLFAQQEDVGVLFVDSSHDKNRSFLFSFGEEFGCRRFWFPFIRWVYGGSFPPVCLHSQRMLDGRSGYELVTRSS